MNPLRQNEPAQIHRMFEASRRGIFRTTSEGLIITANPAMARILGYASDEELLGSAPSIVSHYVDLESRAKWLEKLESDGDAEEYVIQMRRRDGTPIWASIEIRAVADERGERCYEGTIEDITERKRAEEVVREASSRAVRNRRIVVWTELGILGGLSALLYWLASGFGWFEMFSRQVMGSRGSTIMDERAVAAVVLMLGLFLFALRRWHESETEGLSERQLQRALMLLHDELDSRVKQRTAELRETNAALRAEFAERTRAEAALRLQSAALTAAANSIVITDRDGTVVWVNPAFTSLTGYSLEEAAGKNPRDLVKSGKHSEEVYKELWETILAGRVWHGELVNKRKDGSLYPEEQTITPLRDESGVITHFIAIKQDLSERKAAERQLREHSEIVLNSHEGVMIVNLDNKISLWNHGAEQIFGWTPADAVGRSPEELFAPENLDALETLRAAVGRDGFWQGELRLQARDGRKLVVECRTTLVRDENGRPRARLNFLSDATEKKLLEEKFLHAQRLESIGVLAAGITHDLNNVLAPIMFAAPMLRASLSDPRDLKILDILEQSAARGAGLVKQIMGFVHSTTAELRPTEVNPVAADLASILEETFPKSIKIESRFSPGLWPVLGNATQIHQVLLNLCVNARDAMPGGGTLRIAADNRRLEAAEAAAIPGARPGAWVMITVADTGSGIRPEVLARIWTPFFTTKAAEKGTGLGLATVRGIVDTHRGFVELETKAGLGTTFRVFFPAVEARQAERTPHVGVPRGNGELILVVDDDQAVRETVSAILGKHGYRIVCCVDGLDAMASFNASPGEFALVITDVVMPRIGGVALAGALLRIRPDIRVLAISGLTRTESGDTGVSEARKLAHGFLLKPFQVEDLLSAVHGLLGTDKKS